MIMAATQGYALFGIVTRSGIRTTFAMTVRRADWLLGLLMNRLPDR
jgi:hypothetical protein